MAFTKFFNKLQWKLHECILNILMIINHFYFIFSVLSHKMHAQKEEEEKNCIKIKHTPEKWWNGNSVRCASYCHSYFYFYFFLFRSVVAFGIAFKECANHENERTFGSFMHILLLCVYFFICSNVICQFCSIYIACGIWQRNTQHTHTLTLWWASVHRI